MGAKSSDYLESTGLNEEEFPFFTTDLQDLLCELSGLLENVNSEDDDDNEDVKLELSHLAVMTALGLSAIEIASHKELIPMPCSNDFCIVLSDDVESPTWNAGIPVLYNTFNDYIPFIEKICFTAECKKLLLDVVELSLNKKLKKGDFLPILDSLESSKIVRKLIIGK